MTYHSTKSQGLELPAGNSKSKFQQTSKARPCAICGNETGHCKTKEGDRGDLLHYCHNHATKPNAPINGHYFTAAGGDWGIFSNEKPKYQGAQSKAKSTGSTKTEPAVPPTQRDSAFRAYMSKLTLHPDDRADLNRRGVTDEQIQSWGVVSIEGKEPGCIVPCYSPEGLIVGSQWRLRNPSDGTRYKWINWLGGGSKNGGELPLTVHRPIGVEPVGIAVCEGIGAKSFILAQRSGMVAIGAGSDSQFISSPDHWREYLATVFTELGTTTVTMYPDSGAVKNASVMGKYSQWFKFVADIGYTVQVAWWGQSVKGESPDPDELSADVDVKLISVAEFEAMAAGGGKGFESKTPTQTPWKCLSVHNHQIGRWKHIDIPISDSDKVQSYHDRALSDPNLKYTGSRTVKKEDCEVFSEFEPSTNFNLNVSKILEDSTGGGIEFEVTWLDRSTVRSRKALVKTAETLTVKDFVTALTRGLNGHFTSILKAHELAAIIQNRKDAYSLNGGETYRLADRLGQQDDGAWVFERCQFKPDGTPTTEQESRWMFNRSICDTLNIPSPEIAPRNPESLKVLVSALQAFYHAEALPYALLMLGFGVMGLHRRPAMQESGEMASLVVYGEKGSGKSTGHKATAALYGLSHFTPSQVTEPMIFNYAAHLGSLTIHWDDPIRNGDYAKGDEKIVNSALWKFYTGLGRENMLHVQKPQTNLCVSSNRTLGVDTAATTTRIISFIFPKLPVNRNKGHLLNPAFKQASGALSDLLTIPYDRKSIEECGNQLLEHLSEADSRNANSLATLAYFTQKFCDLAGVDFDALSFIKTDICPQTNAQGSGKDSLTDFLEKLAILKAENVVGDWNLNECQSRDGSKYLAVHMAGIWDTFEARFKPNYGKDLVEKLAEVEGGSKNQKRYFVASRDNAMAYQKALNAWDMGLAGTHPPTALKRDRAAKSLLIPRSVAEKAGFFPTEDTPETEQPTAAAPTPEPTREPIAVPQPESTSAVKVPNQPDLGKWEPDGPSLLSEDHLEQYRAEIQKDPSSVDIWKPHIPQSQWNQVGILEDERCAA